MESVDSQQQLKRECRRWNNSVDILLGSAMFHMSFCVGAFFVAIDPEWAPFLALSALATIFGLATTSEFEEWE